MSTDYGKGQVLGAATMLPATSAAGVFLLNGAHPAVVIGFMVVGAIALISTSAYMVRFMANRNA